MLWKLSGGMNTQRSVCRMEQVPPWAAVRRCSSNTRDTAFLVWVKDKAVRFAKAVTAVCMRVVLAEGTNMAKG